MAHTIVERPHSPCLSRNEIRYVYLLDNLSRAGLYLEIQLYVQLIGGSAVLVNTFQLTPDEDGKVYCYVQQYIDAYLTYKLPTLNNTITYADDQACQFYVYTREVTDDDTDDTFNEHEDTKPRLAILSGVEKHRYSRNNLQNYITTNKMWMTWQPNNRFCAVDEPAYVTAFFPSGNSSDYTLEIKAVTTTGEVYDASEAFTGSHYFAHVLASAEQLGVESMLGTGEQLLYWQVAVVDATTAYIINPYRFYKEYHPSYNAQDIIFFNSLGGLCHVRVRGEISMVPEISFEEGQSGISLSEWNAVVKSYERLNIGTTYRNQYKGDVGYLFKRREQKALTELAISPAMYQVVDSRFVPVVNLKKSLDLGKNNDKKYSFPIEWALSESNEVFTPSDITLGIGTDVETYP